MSHLTFSFLTIPCVALTALLGMPPTLAQSSVKTVFGCIPYLSGGEAPQGMATVARRGNAETPPLITWEKTIGRDWTPQKRCQEVVARLNQAVSQNQGKLSGLNLTYGLVNQQSVICYTRSAQEHCSGENLLFTLTGENARDPKKVLEEIKAFALKGGGSRIKESEGILFQDKSGQTYLDLDRTVEVAGSNPDPGV
jgi:hypothetical protein